MENDFCLNVIEEKKALRKKIRSDLKSLFSFGSPTENSLTANERIINLKSFSESHIVLAFLQAGNEISCSKVIEEARRQNKILAVPRVRPGTSQMDFFVLNNDEPISSQTETGSFNISEPLDSLKKIDPKNLSGKNVFAVIPGLGFSKTGERLGKGKGFYDRYIPSIIAKKLTLCGLCFDCQMIQSIPTDSHDFKVDFVVTENQVFECL